jgi:hypothetical protein
MPYVGEVLPLSYQLLDGDGSKFVRAVLLEADGTPLAASPVDMPHVSGGKYSADTVTMPNIDYVEATYESYNDAGYTVPDPDHLLGTDVFRLEIPDSVIVDKLDQIIAKLNGLNLPGAAINARLVQNVIGEVVKDAQAAKALLERDNVSAVIEGEGKVKGLIDDNEITAKIACRKGVT